MSRAQNLLERDSRRSSREKMNLDDSCLVTSCTTLLWSTVLAFMIRTMAAELTTRSSSIRDRVSFFSRAPSLFGR